MRSTELGASFQEHIGSKSSSQGHPSTDLSKSAMSMAKAMAAAVEHTKALYQSPSDPKQLPSSYPLSSRMTAGLVEHRRSTSDTHHQRVAELRARLLEVGVGDHAVEPEAVEDVLAEEPAAKPVHGDHESVAEVRCESPQRARHGHERAIARRHKKVERNLSHTWIGKAGGGAGEVACCALGLDSGG